MGFSSRAIDVSHGLLEYIKGYLVADRYSDYSDIVCKRQLMLVYCDDHARRKFANVVKSLTKDLSEDAKKEAQNWIASQAVEIHKSLYRVEKRNRDMTPEQKRADHQSLACTAMGDVPDVR